MEALTIHPGAESESALKAVLNTLELSGLPKPLTSLSYKTLQRHSEALDVGSNAIELVLESAQREARLIVFRTRHPLSVMSKWLTQEDIDALIRAATEFVSAPAGTRCPDLESMLGARLHVIEAEASAAATEFVALKKELDAVEHTQEEVDEECTLAKSRHADPAHLRSLIRWWLAAVVTIPLVEAFGTGYATMSAVGLLDEIDPPTGVLAAAAAVAANVAASGVVTVGLSIGVSSFLLGTNVSTRAARGAGVLTVLGLSLFAGSAFLLRSSGGVGPDEFESVAWMFDAGSTGLLLIFLIVAILLGGYAHHRLVAAKEKLEATKAALAPGLARQKALAEKRQGIEERLAGVRGAIERARALPIAFEDIMSDARVHRIEVDQTLQTFNGTTQALCLMSSGWRRPIRRDVCLRLSTLVQNKENPS